MFSKNIVNPYKQALKVTTVGTKRMYFVDLKIASNVLKLSKPLILLILLKTPKFI